MNKLSLIFILLLAGLRVVPQDSTVQIPIETQFSNGLIIFTLPTPYSSPSFRPMAIPRFVTTWRTMKVYPDSPSKEALILELQKRLSVSPEIADKTRAIEYLKNVALFIYLSNNNVSALPQQARTSITEWNKANISFREELKLVTKYLEMADEMD